jgi:hypothetical protein
MTSFPESEELPNKPLPKSVAIVAMGYSHKEFISDMSRGTKRFDEVWTLNGFGKTIAHDRFFLMDDLKMQEVRAGQNKYVEGLLDTAKNHPGPVYTSRVYPDYPNLVEYPIEGVINATGSCYLNNSVPYMIAYAVALGVEEISIYGADYTYGDKRTERGRGCVEFWLGLATARGIKVNVPEASSLLDGGSTEIYGYWSENVSISNTDGKWNVERTPKDSLPTLAEIEAIMSHDSSKRK